MNSGKADLLTFYIPQKLLERTCLDKNPTKKLYLIILTISMVVSVNSIDNSTDLSLPKKRRIGTYRLSHIYSQPETYIQS